MKEIRLQALSAVGISVVAIVLACSAARNQGGGAAQQSQAAAAGSVQAPRFEVDPFWPKPLPNHWILGPTIGVDVDSRDHVWIVHRNAPDLFGARTEIGAAQDPPVSECCIPAPPVLEFDPEGNLVGSWGGKSPTVEYEWP